MGFFCRNQVVRADPTSGADLIVTDPDLNSAAGKVGQLGRHLVWATSLIAASQRGLATLGDPSEQRSGSSLLTGTAKSLLLQLLYGAESFVSGPSVAVHQLLHQVVR